MMRGTYWGDVVGLKNKNNAPAPRGRARFLFTSIISLLGLLVFPSYQPCVVRGSAILSSSDGEVLLELKHSIVTCDSNNLLSDWNENDSDPCSWSGVRCNPDSRRVVSLVIQGKQTHNASSNPAHHVDLDVEVDCGRSGTLSPVVEKLSELRRLSITNNRLTGELPQGIAGLKSLRVLDLRSNLLTGQIPSELGKLSNLRVLNLANNAFQGSIPSELSSCHQLRHLSLSGNVLSGSIPPSLGSLPRLQRLSLSSNNLLGSIPIHLFEKYGGGCRLVYLDLSGNQLSGSIPAEIGSCTQLRWVLLNFNNLVGNIPANLGKLLSLKSLQLAGNHLSGSVPQELTGCTLLEYLVLTSHHSWSSCLHRMEGNNFHGALPPGLASLPILRVLWGPGAEGIPEISTDIVERHHLCNVHLDAESWRNGRVVSPQAVHDRSPDISSNEFVRRKLTDQNSSTSLLGPSRKGTQRKMNSIFVAAITSGCAIAIVIFSLGLIFQCSKFRKKRPPSPTRQQQQEVSRKLVTFMNVHQSLTYDNIVKATGNFSIDNLIGSGGFGATYKAEVKPGVLVAVKRLSIGRFHGAQQFETEIRTLGRIRHPNLVTLIGYHASRDEMFLIYNFFSQGNLETLIHTHKEQMDWKTRHSIAFRMAEALAFLHDDCVPRVLHRDIKPSNILLDDDLNAHLSDFGLARLLGASETHATTDVAGTFGYVAPEYAMTCRVTDKADVYSYGVVLLELISGKKALDPSFSEYGDGFNIVSWACLLIRQGRAPEVFPTNLWEMGPEKSLLETLKLAVLCTVDQLQIRPAMKEVVDTLGKIRPAPAPT